MACEDVSKDKKVCFLVWVATLMMMTCGVVDGKKQVPCVFIFGDSLSDGGNNNNLKTSAKSNYVPYGIDFPHGPTGRFTNGRTSIDFISQFLGLKKLIPPFAKLGGYNILKGVNYASGAAGIRVDTGTQLGDNINLGLQLRNHREIVSEIAAKLGSFKKAKKRLKKCLYYLNIGSNDYINNYFLPQYFPTSTFFTQEQFAVHLMQHYSLTLRALHKLGGRKFVLVGVGAIGCTPMAISANGKSSSCVDEMNKAALIFNSNLKSLVDQFNHQHSDSKFIFINSTAGTIHKSLGFKVLNAGCCRVGEDGQCAANERPCNSRKEFVFFDSFHPTEAANFLIAISSYNASINPAFTYPMDIAHLLHT